jgi:hypothetical protein
MRRDYLVTIILLVSLAALLLIPYTPSIMAAWDVTTPAGTDNVSTVDDTIRADKSTLLTAIGAEHDFSASTTTGVHDEGAARCWVDTAANRSSRDSSEGRLFIETDTQKVYYGDSGDAWVQLTPKRNTARLSTTPQTQISWTATAFTDISTLTVDITSKAGAELFIACTVTLKNTVSGKKGYLCLGVDSVEVTDATDGQAVVEYDDAREQTFTLTRLVQDGDGPGDGIDLSAGSHTVTLRAKVESGGACELIQNVNQTIFVHEL